MLAGLLLTANACTTGDDVGSESADDGSVVETQEAAPAAQIPCADTVDTDADLPDSYAVILDVVALPTADSADTALQTDHREDAPRPNYWAKAGLVARPGVPFTLEVSDPVATAQIGWGSPGVFASSFTAPECSGEEGLRAEAADTPGVRPATARPTSA